MAWVHLTTAPDELTAQMWVELLRDKGIVAAIRPSDSVSFLGMTSFGCRLQVAEEQLEAARAVLGDLDVDPEDEG